ncbi:unnamed protein product [Ceutorhynchus assimilis]|uniref:Uncharacterized protein n=1 Tax=Ceutorhynchus assimilis TaxID=467358 RepID=A0A9N9QFN6_9CUCU|nr:unnamed protein product [Ceutorhynchus assimilis]
MCVQIQVVRPFRTNFSVNLVTNEKHNKDKNKDSVSSSSSSSSSDSDDQTDDDSDCDEGPDYAILALSGHILLAQSKLNEAQNEYFRVIEAYNRPQNIHLVYINCAEILSKLGNIKKAIKLILIACKIHETPHLWFSAGKLYYHQNDLLNAEECLNRANLKDNRHAEVWGYLTLLNLKLSKIHEAMSCYQQAVKSGLEDGELNQSIVQAFKKA